MQKQAIRKIDSLEEDEVGSPPTANYTPIVHDSTPTGNETKTRSAPVEHPPPSSYNELVEEKRITLNEPVCDTIKRDLFQIGFKIKQVMLPSLREQGKKQMRNWDLWGPFVICLMLSLTLSFRTEAQAETVFGTIFVIMWAGAFVVTINARYLGATISFFQSACLLGYCVFPINLAALAVALFGGMLPALVKLALVAVSFFWSTLSALSFLIEVMPSRRRKLALYPIFLFYLFLSWFALVV